MEKNELQEMWTGQSRKIDQLLAINTDMAILLSRQKISKQISRLYRPKWTAVIIGLPYAFLLAAIAIFALLAKAYLVALGFGAISLITAGLLAHYFYQIYLIGQVKNNEAILSTQQQLSKLRISSFRSLRLAIFQLPFWSICWVSLDALKADPFIYGGVNLLVFSLLTFIAYWLFQKLSHEHKASKVRDFFLSGVEWDPIIKSAEILEQLKEYEE